jgi:rod shape-determining protein MreD
VSRNLLATIVVIAALVLQVTVANRLPLPGSVIPDLVLLAVVALALVNGSLLGLVAGFCAGLATDIVPPADHTIGRYALVYCLIGYVCGLASRVLPLQVFYDMVASPFVVWAVLHLTRRAERPRNTSGLEPVPGYYRAR